MTLSNDNSNLNQPSGNSGMNHPDVKSQLEPASGAAAPDKNRTTMSGMTVTSQVGAVNTKQTDSKNLEGSYAGTDSRKEDERDVTAKVKNQAGPRSPVPQSEVQ